MVAASTSAAGIEYETVVEGAPLTLAAEVGGGQGPFSYQWYKNGAPLAGATHERLGLAAVQLGDAGLYAVVVANAGGSAASLPVFLEVTSAQPSRLANVSIVAAASEPVSVNFTLAGGLPAELNRLLLRAAGPALVPLGVVEALPDPVLELLGPGGVIAVNDNWEDDKLVAITAAAVGAFSFPVGSRDAALIADLPSGGYTARVLDADDATGTTAVELYKVRHETFGWASRLVQVSARALSGATSFPFTMGFSIEGRDPVRILLRGIGPGRAVAEGAPVIANPRLDLFRRSTLLATNDDWGDAKAGETTAAAAAVGAFALPNGSLDAALLVTLEPGTYTVQLNSEQKAPGWALIELYVVP